MFWDKDIGSLKTEDKAALTCDDVRLHGELVAAFLYAAVEGWDVLLLSECVGLRKHHLYLSHVALLKPPARCGGEKKEKKRDKH